MIALDFKETNVNIAEKQDEYLTLPAFRNTWEGSTTVCFKLEPHELEELKNNGGKIFLKLYTGNGLFPPIHTSCLKQDLIVPPTNVTIIFGLQASGKSNVLREIAKKAPALWVSEQELMDGAIILPSPDKYSHILIDDAIGSPQLREFVIKWREQFKIVIATQTREVADCVGHCNLVDLPIPPNMQN